MTTMMTLAAAATMLPKGRLLGDPAVSIARVHTDSRTVQPGDCFVALRGERFDGHDMLAAAKAAGAVAAIAEHGLAAAGLPGIEVADTMAALDQLARAWRRGFDVDVIAVTGSNGKTTVTQMIASILQSWLADASFATRGNFNNHIGVPLTLLRMRHGATETLRAGVVEIGMNHPGEIASLAAGVAPSVVLVNNAQREHLEFMADVRAVAAENGSAIAALGSQGTAVFPADDAYTAMWRELAGTRRVLTFALEGYAADVIGHAEWLEDRWLIAIDTPQGHLDAKLRSPGLHNVKNALAAAACVLAIGCPLDRIASGFDRFAPVKGRSDVKRFRHHDATVTLVDDTYNANPDSVLAAIDVLAALEAPHWLVLGDMGEVGDQGPAFHREVGRYAKARGIESMWAVGDLSGHATSAFGRATHFLTVPDLVAAIGDAPDFRSVLVKGSRFMQMERVVAALTGSPAEASHAA